MFSPGRTVDHSFAVLFADHEDDLHSVSMHWDGLLASMLGTLMRHINGLIVLVGILVLPMQAFAQGNSQTGQEVAERWCSSCHRVTPEQAQVSAGVPSFMIIARRSGRELDWLNAFLADPHPPMPNLSLTRQEIKDLVAYFRVLQKK